MHPTDLEPSRLTHRMYLSRRRYAAMDAVVLLSIMFFLLYLIPANLVLPIGLAEIGRPAMVVGLLMWSWWVLGRLGAGLVLVGRQPMRWAVLALLLTALISYANGQLRGMTVTEANGADRGMIGIAVFAGVILVTADGIRTWDRIRVIVKVFVWCAVYAGVIGLLQSILRLDLTQYLRFPGLQFAGVELGADQRGAGLRVASVTFHYIEFSTVMAMALPFAFHLARFSATMKERRRYVAATVVIAMAVPIAISRTGIVAVGVVACVLFPLWKWRMRFNVAGAALVLVGGLAVVKPGLIGTITNLFSGAGQDSSVTARTDRYGLVGYYFAQHPWLGRGIGTWIPPQYQILDNMWLTWALTTGWLGVAVLSGLHVTALVMAATAMRNARTSEDRHLCGILVAMQLVALVVAATFDSMSFTTYSTTLAFTIGCAGAVWRLTHPEREVRTSAIRPDTALAAEGNRI